MKLTLLFFLPLLSFASAQSEIREIAGEHPLNPVFVNEVKTWITTFASSQDLVALVSYEADEADFFHPLAYYNVFLASFDPLESPQSVVKTVTHRNLHLNDPELNRSWLSKSAIWLPSLNIDVKEYQQFDSELQSGKRFEYLGPYRLFIGIFRKNSHTRTFLFVGELSEFIEICAERNLPFIELAIAGDNFMKNFNSLIGRQ